MARRAAGPPAVVVGLDCITGLQTARILARRGVPVIGIASDPGHPCARTRRVRRVVGSPTSGEPLVEALTALSEELPDGAVLVPCTDAAVLTLARERHRLPEGYRLMLAATETVEMLMDKLRFYEFAERQGLPVPATRILRSREEALAAAETIPYPCILKPTLKTPEWERNSKEKVHRAETPGQLLWLYDRYSPFADALMVQQWIDGPDAELYSCNCYYDRGGRPVATFVARKLRQWPPRTGTSCLGEEVRNDVVLDLTLRTLGVAEYRGLGYLEVKRDATTGAHYIIEANVGRPTGRSAIAEAGGVELLYAMYCDAVGRPLPDALEQRYVGARWIYWRQDVRSAFYYWRQGELTLREWAASWRGRKTPAVLSWSDPVPFLSDLASAPGRIRGRGREKGRGAEGTPAAEPEATRAREPVAAPRTNGGGPHQRGEDHARHSRDARDIDVAGVMGVRVVGGSAADRAAVRRQLGGVERDEAGEPDVVLRFVDRLPREGLRHVEVGRSAFTADGYMVRAPGRGSPWVRVPFEDAGGPCEFVCERGVRRVPLLKHFLRLRALEKGYLPFHASAFEWQGTGVLVAGWSHGGKTSSLLAFGANGARYVGDDLVLIAGDGSSMRGLSAPIAVSEWHLSQLPHLQQTVGYRKRMLAAATRRLNDAALTAQQDGSRIPGLPVRVAARMAQKKSRVVLPIETVFPGGAAASARPDKLFLMMSADGEDAGVEPVSAATVARRMRHSLAAEALPMLEHYHSYRYAGIGEDNPRIEGMATEERRLLDRAVAGLDAYIVRHPYPAPFAPLFDAMRPACEERRTARVDRLTAVRA